MSLPVFPATLTMFFLSCAMHGAPPDAVRQMVIRAVSRVMCGLMGFVAMAAMPAYAQSSPDGAAPAAIHSDGQVDKLFSAPTNPPSANDFDARQKAIDRRSAENDYEYALAQHNCYDKFFVNHCLDVARNRMRVVQADIRHDQLALDGEERADHARQRDEQAALQRAQDETNAPQRAANAAQNEQEYADKLRQHALDEAQNAADAPQRAANEARNVQAYDEKQRQHVLSAVQRGDTGHRAASRAALAQPGFQQKLEAARQEGAQKAQQRAQNVAKYQQKQANAAQHKAAVERRQQQAAEKAKQKQQQQKQQQSQPHQ